MRGVMAAAVAVAFLTACGNGDELLLHGTVEVREVNVAPLVAGRVTSVRVEEGEEVRAGDTVAVVTAPTLAADLAAAVARRDAARALVRDLEAGAEPEAKAAAAAELAGAEAEAVRLVRDRDRVAALLAAGAVAPRDHDAAVAAAAMATARRDAARERLALLEAGARRDRIAAARAELMHAESVLEARKASNEEYVLVAPVAGVVLARLAEPGALVAPTGSVVRIGEVRAPWVRVFVPARLLPSLALGDSAAIYPPGAGGAVAEGGAGDVTGRGIVSAINPRAEFVTRAALTEEERADLLFGVRVAIADTAGRFKPGMPVQVRLYPTVPTP